MGTGVGVGGSTCTGQGRGEHTGLFLLVFSGEFDLGDQLGGEKGVNEPGAC